MKNKFINIFVIIGIICLFSLGISFWIITFNIGNIAPNYMGFPNDLKLNPLYEYEFNNSIQYPNDIALDGYDISYQYKYIEDKYFSPITATSGPVNAGKYYLHVTATNKTDSTVKLYSQVLINIKPMKVKAEFISVTYEQASTKNLLLSFKANGEGDDDDECFYDLFVDSIVFKDSKGIKRDVQLDPKGYYMTNGVYSYNFTESINVVGSTYLLNLKTFSSNYIIYDYTDGEYKETGNTILKYQTAILGYGGTTYHTIEDAIKNAGSNLITFPGNYDSYVTTCFSGLDKELTGYNSTAYYTLNTKLRVPFADVNMDYHGSAGFTSSSSIWADRTLVNPENCENVEVKAYDLVYSVLEIPSNVTLTINSNKKLVIGSLVYDSGYVLNRGILINNGTIICNGNIEAFGYVKGIGTVEFNNGSKLTEVARVFDWKGGGLTAGYNNAKIFPIESFSIHNISCKTVYYAGAVLEAFWMFRFDNMLYQGCQRGDKNGNIIVLGNGDDKLGIFNLTSGYIERTINNPKNADSQYYIDYKDSLTQVTGSNQIIGQRELYTIYGTVFDSKINIKISASGQNVNAQTSTTIPISFCYLDVILENGSDVIFGTNSYIIMPGTSFIVNEGAQLNVINGAYIMVYSKDDCTTDQANMGLYSFMRPYTEIINSDNTISVYTPLCIDQNDAIFEVNGEVMIDSTAFLGGCITTKSVTGKLFMIGTPSVTIKYVTSVTEGALTDTVNNKTKTYNAIGKIAENRVYDENGLFITKYLYITESKTSTDYYFNGSSDYDSFEIEYNTMGGNALDNSIFYSFDDNVTVTKDDLSIPSKPYYNFKFWYYLDENNNKNEFTEYTLTATNSSLTVYAEYEPKNYILEHNIVFENDNTKEYIIDNLEFSINTETITLVNPSYDGYIFEGWYLTSELSLSSLIKPRTYTFSELMSNFDESNLNVTIYGVFTQKIKYTITYNTMNVNVTDFTTTKQYEEGTEFNLPILENEGYNFIGWYTNQDLTGDSVTKTTANGDITYYAKWEIKKFTITFDSNGGSAVDSQTIDYGGKVTKPSNPSQSGKDFVEWRKEGENSAYNFDTLVDSSFTLVAQWKDSCIVSGTLITLANGSQKKVEELTLNDSLLVFNHEIGKFETASIVFIDDDGWKEYNIVNLVFSNGNITRLIYEHGYFNLTLNKYVYITESNYRDYINHEFILVEGEKFSTVTLIDSYITDEYVGCYSPVTAVHLNYIVDGMLSMPGGIEGIFNIFEYGEDLKFDKEQMQSDIEKYGIMEYEELAEYVPYEMYVAFNAKYFNVAIGKGLITFDEILYYIEKYLTKHGLA